MKSLTKTKMTKLLACIYVLLFTISIDAFTQINLVTNGNFENYSTCPTTFSQLYMCNGWLNVSRFFLNEGPCSFGYTQCTSDYFNSCATSTSPVDVPLNFGGFQNDHSSQSGYSGIIAYSLSTGNCVYGGVNEKWREYVGSSINPMILGDKYKLSYYASLSDSSRVYCHIGFILSTGAIPMSYNSTTIPPPAGSIFYNSPSNIASTPDWNLISHEFICTDPTLNFLTIGNFTDTSLIQVTAFKPLLVSTTVNTISNLAYYYIDDVSLIKTDSMPHGNLQQFYSLCNANYPILDAGAGSLGTIQWYKDGIAIPGPIGTSRFYTPSSIGVYSFIVTSTLIPGLTYTSTTTIYDSPANVQMLSLPYTNCDTNLTVSILNPQSNLTYSWTVSNVLTGYPSTYTGTYFTTILDASALSHVITLHITDSKSPCIFDTAITIYQCCRRDKLKIYSDQRSAVLISYDIDFSSGIFGTSACQFCNDVSFDGTLLIDQNLTFKNTAIYMQPYAKIDVTDGDTLRLDSCYLTACTNIMWQGINNGTLAWGNGTIIAKNCIIEDAIAGITVLNGSYTHCIADTFNKNRKDIVVKPFAGFYSPLQVIKSSFICKDLGLRAYLSFPDPLDNLGLLINPYWALKPHECIFLDHVQSVAIGSPCISCTNYFDNAYTGIHAMNTNISIYNNEFTNMAPNLTYTGAGILLDKSYGTDPMLTYSTIVGGYLISQNNYFTNSRYGIISRNVLSTIQNNTLDNCVTGIMVDSTFTPLGNQPSLCIVKDNVIKNYTRGIEADFNTRSKIQMLRNKLQTNPPSIFTPVITGILVNQSLYPSIYEIIDNEIVSGRLGINLNNVVQSIIRGNSIRMNSTTGFSIMGISSSNTTRTLYSNNSVVGDNTSGGVVGSTYANSKAIYFSMSPNDTVYCNTTDTMTWGLEFMGNCLSTNNIAGNIMKRHYDQMTLRTSGIIGSQTGRVFPPLVGTKLMANEFTTSTYLNSNTCAFNSFAGANLYYAKNIAPFYPFINVVIGGGSALSPLGFTTPNYICDPYIHGGSGGGSGLMAGGGEGSDDEKVIAEEIIHEMIASDIYTEDYQLGLKKELYYDLNIDGNLRDSSYIIDSFYLAAKENNIGKLYEVRTSIENDLSVDALIKNSAVIPHNNIEINEKIINEIVLNLGLTGFTEDIMDQLYAIADQCPISGGKSVFTCRSLISSLDLNAFWDDDERCLFGIDYRKSNPLNELEAPFDRQTSIFPNPANDVLFIIQDKSDSRSQYIIRDIFGKIVFKSLPNIILPDKIDVSLFAAGMYIIEISISDQKRQYKFNIKR